MPAQQVAEPRKKTPGSGLRGFLLGVGTGALGVPLLALMIVYALNMTGVVIISAENIPALHSLLVWANKNLGLSLIFFALTLILYFAYLSILWRRLANGDSIDRVAQAEHVVDVWVSVFFGIGVIWTAIGMRGALLYALADVSQLGGDPSGVLQRLVDGGILVALSTTIFGGIGGYLMRVFKTLLVGSKLKRYYQQSGTSQGDSILNTLERIEQLLERTRHAPKRKPETTDEPTLDPEPGYPDRI